MNATLHTNHGDIEVVLFPEQAPKAVENFVTLAKQGYFDGLTFHRVVKDFVIQSGDPTGSGTGGQRSHGGRPRRAGPGLGQADAGGDCPR